MKLSELIKQLQEIEKEQGDFECKIYANSQYMDIYKLEQDLVDEIKSIAIE